MLPTSTLAAGLLLGSLSLTYLLFRLYRVVVLPKSPHDDSTNIDVTPSPPPPPNASASASANANANDKRKIVEGLVEGERSYDALGRAVLELSALLLVTWLCENRPVFPHAGKIHDMDFFLFVIVTAFVCGLVFSIHREPQDQGILNRDQTEEWRGFMQMVFLLYHYFALEEVYPLIRLFISCYVFLTGFGNTSFFYLRRDYSFVRLASMLWRLCFSCVALAFVHDNPLILYYIVPLHTFYFLMAYCVMSALEMRVNYTKYGLRIKLTLLGLLIFAVWEFPAVFRAAFFFLSSEPHPGAAVGAYGTQYEWQFRSGLDHYSAFFGMVFACGFPMLEFRDAQVFSTPGGGRLKLALCAVFLLIGAAWCAFLFPLPKFTCNAKHAYTFAGPMCAYLFLRNATPFLRRTHLAMFAYAGKYTLETYLLQHHVWLTSNAKTVLVLIPGFPKVNFLVVSVLYFLLSVKLFDLTTRLKVLLLPSNNDAGVKWNLVMLGGMLGLCIVLAELVVATGEPGLGLAFVVLLAGVWGLGVAFALKTTTTTDPALSSPSLSGKLVRGVIVLVSLAFAIAGVVLSYTMEQQPPSPASLGLSCDVNAGSWVREFAGLCDQAPQVNFAYCYSSAWAWDVSEQKRCGWKRVGNLKAYGKIVLVSSEGENNHASVLTSLAQAMARIDQPKLAFNFKIATVMGKPNSNLELGNKVVAVVRNNNNNNDEVNKIVAGTTEPVLVVCLTRHAFSTCEAVGKKFPGHASAILLGQTENDLAYSKEAMVDAARVWSAPGAVREKLDGGVFSDAVYDVLAQLALNQAGLNAKISAAAGTTAAPQPPTPGGLAYSPIWGSVFLGVAFACLFLGDGFLGLVALFARISGQAFIPWETAYEKVHLKIPGVTPIPPPVAPPGHSPRTSARDHEHLSDADDAEKGKLIASAEEGQ